MSGLLADIRRLNELGDRSIAEPFAGGAGASISLLYLEETTEILINDFDKAIHDIWWSIVHHTSAFLKLLDETQANMCGWRKQRKIYKDRKNRSRIRRGFAAFYLNRCNRSGIIMNGGPIGGVEQTGEWKLDARFNKKDLKTRCEKIAEYGERIQISSQDGIEFISKHDLASTFFFIDPPYF